MSLFNSFKNLFHKKKQIDTHITISRRNYDITMPQYVFDNLSKENISISVSFGKNKQPSTVQLTKLIDGKSKYIGTLKSYMNVKSFKDGNICNFHQNNIIKE